MEDAYDNDRHHVYTDGACSGNPGPGGWAWAVDGGRQGSGGDPQTTNQRMELQAVLEALCALDGSVTIHSDSTYVVNCFRDGWWKGWLARGWKNSNKKPVANRDLWEPLVELFQDRSDELEFVWVKGHSGDRMNDYVDALAVGEVDAVRQPPAEAPEAEVDPAEAPWPVDQAIAATGARELDGDQVETIEEAVAGLDPGFDVVVSGLRRGAELAIAELALKAGVPLGVVLPFADPAAGWPPSLKQRFDACTSAATWTVTLAGDPAKPQSSVEARDRWLWRSVVGAITVGREDLTDELEELGLGVIEL